MKLTRRDALFALAGGIGVGVGSAELDENFSATSTEDSLTKAEIDQLVAIAEVVYPSEVTEYTTFVENYATGLPEERQRSIAETLSELNAYTRRNRSAPLTELSPDTREGVLQAIGTGRVGSDPVGSFPERVRYFIVNQLLYGLFRSPKGGQLVGISNPVGYPGGYESYQRPPAEGDGTLDVDWDRGDGHE